MDRYVEHQGRLVDTETGTIWGRAIATHVDSSGYRQVYVAKGKTVQAHRYIWEAVHGPIPEGMQINHMNGDKADNRLENLELLTQRDNILHAYRTGLASNKGSRHPGARLNNIRVYAIRALMDLGVTATEIHRRSPHAVSRRQIADIGARRSWAHLPERTARIEDL